MPRVKQTKRRRGRGRKNRSSTFSNQTKYHHQEIGFEETFTIAGSTGAVLTIGPENYAAPTSTFFSCSSAYFGDRFVPAWRSWRMLGWKGTVIVNNSEVSDIGGTMAVARYYLSKQAITPVTYTTIPEPIAFALLCELPGAKVLQTNSVSNKNRATFSYFNARKDMNDMPFQELVASGGIESGNFKNLPSLFVSGLLFYYQSTIDRPVSVTISGKLVIEFKDPQMYVPPGGPNLDMDYLTIRSPQPTTKRLQRPALV